MINRVLIRIRVLQIFFSWSQRDTKDLKKAEEELFFSFEKSYDLYHFYLSLLLDLTDEHDRINQQRKTKLLATEEDKRPNTKLVDNLFIKQLRQNYDLGNFLKSNSFEWSEQHNFLRSSLNKILESDTYKTYIANKEQSYEEDKEFWRKNFKDFFVANEELDSILEDNCIYWNDDNIAIVESFVLKTIKQFDESQEENFKLLPLFRDNDDETFAKKLLKEALYNANENAQRIEKYASNWETERITLMDRCIMQIALAELKSFPSIPINVTMNEYINIAKNYSTPKSSLFINGVLDSIVKELKDNNEIVKIETLK